MCRGAAAPAQTMARYVWALLLPLTLVSAWAPLARQRRQLIWPPNGSKVQLILGFGIPIDVPQHSVTMGLVLKYNYKIPTNASEVTQPYVLYQRRAAEPSTTRWAVYHALEDASRRAGMDGRACSLRAICEAAAAPLHTHSGLAGELLHVLLTPSSTNEDKAQYPEREYMVAERVGRAPGDACGRYRRGCPVGLLDLITSVAL